VAGLQLIGDLLRNSAFRRVGFDVFDHLGFGLGRKLAIRLAGFGPAGALRSLAGLDQACRVFSASSRRGMKPFMQASEGPAVGRRRAALRNAEPVTGRGPPVAGNALGAAAAGAPVHGRKRKRKAAGAAGLLTGATGARKCALGAGLGRRGRLTSACGQPARSNSRIITGVFSGKVQAAPISSDRSTISDRLFYDSLPSLNNPSIWATERHRARGPAGNNRPRILVLSVL